jgi:hypothetical protein
MLVARHQILYNIQHHLGINLKAVFARRDYQQLIPIVLDNWEEVKRICKQAAKFENDLKAIVERVYYN